MVTSVPKSTTLLVFLWLFLLLSNVNGETDLCRNPSELWKGPCYRTDHCHSQCKEKESAVAGYCHDLECYCEFSCENLCQKLSGIWKGLCLNSAHCSQQCREKENSLRGSCFGFRCWCQYNCN